LGAWRELNIWERTPKSFWGKESQVQSGGIETFTLGKEKTVSNEMLRKLVRKKGNFDQRRGA